MRTVKIIFLLGLWIFPHVTYSATCEKVASKPGAPIFTCTNVIERLRIIFAVTDRADLPDWYFNYCVEKNSQVTEDIGVGEVSSKGSTLIMERYKGLNLWYENQSLQGKYFQGHNDPISLICQKT